MYASPVIWRDLFMEFWRLLMSLRKTGVVVQSPSHVRLFATPWTAAHQASLSFTISWSFLKLMSIEWVMPSNHLIHCHPLLLLPSVFASIRVFPSESALHIRCRILLQQKVSWVLLPKPHSLGHPERTRLNSKEGVCSWKTPEFRQVIPALLWMLIWDSTHHWHQQYVKCKIIGMFKNIWPPFPSLCISVHDLAKDSLAKNHH